MCGYFVITVVLGKMQPELGLLVLWGGRLLIFLPSDVSIRPFICWPPGLVSQLSGISRLLQSAWLMSWSMPLKGPLTGTESFRNELVWWYDVFLFDFCGVCSWLVVCWCAAMLLRRRTRLRELPRPIVKVLQGTIMQQWESFVCILFFLLCLDLSIYVREFIHLDWMVGVKWLDVLDDLNFVFCWVPFELWQCWVSL